MKTHLRNIPPRARSLLLTTVIIIAVTHFFVRFDIKWHYEGLFLLKGHHDWRWELKDHLYVGDGERLLLAWDWNDPRYRLFRYRHPHVAAPHLYLEWDNTDGSGFIRNFLADGTYIFTSFGRFANDDGKYVHGLFIGGTLPANILGNDNSSMNMSGMAYRDETRWYHLWCNVNEALISPYTRTPVVPSDWKFLGSRIISGGSHTVVLSSSHAAELDAVPLRIDRIAYLQAGKPYLLLTVTIRNIGRTRANYYYVYGDEPWTGNYGSSRGNVGWVKDGLVQYEGVIDSRKYSWAGMFDYGNSVIGEGHDFTGTASFIQWFGKEVPEVYFANDGNGVSESGTPMPLHSETRFIGLQWGPRQLAPGESATYVMAIGMAKRDPVSGFPRKPDVSIANVLLRGIPPTSPKMGFTALPGL